MGISFISRIWKKKIKKKSHIQRIWIVNELERGYREKTMFTRLG